jgi:hypothetical protein
VPIGGRLRATLAPERAARKVFGFSFSLLITGVGVGVGGTPGTVGVISAFISSSRLTRWLFGSPVAPSAIAG